MKSNLLFILVIGIVLQPSYAYLDPGTGSMLLSALIAIFASLFFGIKALYYKLSTIILRIAGVEVDKTQHDLVIYSEGHNYWSTFKPIVEELLSKNQPVFFLTSSEKDPALQLQHPLFEAKYIGEGNRAFVYLSFIEAKVCILTTPGLDVLQLKRSKGVKKYVHLLHSLSSVSLYKIFSFDYYDTILCSGNYQKEELRLLEARRGTEPKLLLDSGCPYIDTIAERKALLDQAKGLGTEGSSVDKVSDAPLQKKRQVLIAPSWGQNGLLQFLPIDTLRQILDKEVDVVIRPHPQSMISEKALIENLQENLQQYPNLRWDFATDNFESLSTSDLLISDFSGINFDFALVFERPIITVRTESHFDGVEHFDLADRPIWENEVIAKMGLRITKEQFGELPTLIDTVMEDARYIENIQNLKRDEFYNFGCSKSVIVTQIQNLLVKDATQVTPQVTAQVTTEGTTHA